MPSLFDPISIGTLTLRNRLMRSATAERISDPDTGAPAPRLAALYRALAEGGVGLIVTGHAYVARSGKAHPEMSSIAEDTMIPIWREVIRPAREAGARVMMQINHGGASCDPAVTCGPLSPSGVSTNAANPSRAMADEEIRSIVLAFGRAARRARDAGLDGVQLHGAHGYLISQFLTPATNLRADAWGGDAERRRAFLAAAVAEVRAQVGADYPVWIKLGMAGAPEYGPSISEGARTVAECGGYGLDCVEISHGMGEPEECRVEREGRYLPMAEAARRAVGPDYPLALVQGLRSRAVMEQVLASGVVQLISMCRPLVLEPDLPNKLRMGLSEKALCLTCDRCWPEALEQGVACRHPRLKEKPA